MSMSTNFSSSKLGPHPHELFLQQIHECEPVQYSFNSTIPPKEKVSNFTLNYMKKELGEKL